MSIFSNPDFRAFVVARVSKACDDIAYTQEYRDLIESQKEAKKDPNPTIKTLEDIDSLEVQMQTLSEAACYMQGWRDGIRSLLNSVAS